MESWMVTMNINFYSSRVRGNCSQCPYYCRDLLGGSQVSWPGWLSKLWWPRLAPRRVVVLHGKWMALSNVDFHGSRVRATSSLCLCYCRNLLGSSQVSWPVWRSKLCRLRLALLRVVVPRGKWMAVKNVSFHSSRVRATSSLCLCYCSML